MSTLTVRRPRRPATARLPGLRVSALSPPIAFTVVWAVGAGLEQIHLFSIQRPWSGVTWLVVVAVPLAFVAGALVGREVVERRVRRRPGWRVAPSATRRLRVVLAGCVGLAYLELAHQMIVGGAVPLLSSNIDAARFGQPGGPTILLVDLMTVASIVALSVPRTLLSRDALPELAIAGIALIGFALQGGREVVVLPLVASFLARWLYWGRPRTRLLVGGALVLVVLVAGLFFFRSHQHSTGRFESELYHKVLPETPLPLKPLVPVDVGIATNFEALARVVDAFPAYYPYGHGAYNALALHRFVPGTKNLSAVSQTLTPPFVVSTAAGPLWADDGMVLTVVGMALIGALVAFAYAWARRTREFRHALAAGYLLYLMLFCVYTNLFTQELDWVLVTPLLLVVGAIAEDAYDPPGLIRLARTRRIGFNIAPPSTGGTDARRRGRRTILGASAILAALFSGAVAVNATRPATNGPPPTIFGVRSRITLPATEAIDRSTTLAADGDFSVDNEPIWTLRRRGRRLAVSEISIPTSGAPRIRRFTLILPSNPRRPVFAVTHWGAGPAIAVMTRRARGVEVRILSLHPARTLVTGFARMPRARPGATRDLFIGTWSGDRPDLFVIDRGLPSKPVRIRVFAGETRFERIMVQRTIPTGGLPVRGLPPRAWSIDVARIDRPRPDLVLIYQTAPSHRMEVHLLKGESAFAAFLFHAGTVLPARPGIRYRFTAATRFGFPGLYAVRLRRTGSRVLVFLPFVPEPPPVGAARYPAYTQAGP